MMVRGNGDVATWRELPLENPEENIISCLWIARVPSKSNISDGPSRACLDELMSFQPEIVGPACPLSKLQLRSFFQSGRGYVGETSMCSVEQCTMVQPVWWAACGGTDFTPVRQGAKTIVTELASFSSYAILSASELIVISNYIYARIVSIL